MSNLVISGYEPFTIAGRSASRIGYITPAATFTATTPSSAAGGTKTTLTSAGAHGLTAAVAVNKHLSITAGTGWTAGLYNISSIDLDTTGVAVTIDAAYDAGMGAPTISLAGTEIIAATIAIPSLGLNSYIEGEYLVAYPNSANTKTTTIKLGGSTLSTIPVGTGAGVNLRIPFLITNRGVTNSQIGTVGSGGGASNSGYGFSNSATTTTSVNTATSTSLTISLTSSTANEFVYLERYLVKVFV